MDNQLIYRANGKILLTGEYLVLHGAVSLALPLILGQEMKILAGNTPELNWQASDTTGKWFNTTIQLPSLEITTYSDLNKAQLLVQWLKAARKLNPEFLMGEFGYDVTTELDFDRHWGFGSSSTLIYCLAKWAGVDAFELHDKVANGSGYDVACAGANRPLLYEIKDGRRKVLTSSFSPPFATQLQLVYLGKKQHSSAEVESFNQSTVDYSGEVQAISDITFEMEYSRDLTGFMKLMKEHEEIISKILGRDTVKSLKFSNFGGEIKSLGAWGGDFILAASPMEPGATKQYFADQGYHTILPFSSVVAGMPASAAAFNDDLLQ